MEEKTRQEKLEALYDKAIEAEQCGDFEAARRHLNEALTITGPMTGVLFTLAKLDAIEKYGQEGEFYTEPLKNAAVAHLEHVKSLWESLDDQEKSENSSYVFDECSMIFNDLHKLLTGMFSETVNQWALDDAGIAKTVKTSPFCSGLAKLAFFIGDKIEELFSTENTYSTTIQEIAVALWHAGCTMMEVLSGYYSGDHKARAKYSEKIHKYDESFPIYKVPLDELDLEELLEQSKQKKFLYSLGTKIKEEIFVVPQEVERIGSYVLRLNDNVKTVVIHKNVKVIQDYAFAWSRVKNIVIERGSKLETVGAYAFECFAEKVKVPVGCKVDPKAFGKYAGKIRRMYFSWLLEKIKKEK